MTTQRRMPTSEIDPPTEYEIELSKIKVQGAIFVPDGEEFDKFAQIIITYYSQLNSEISNWLRAGYVLPIENISDFNRLSDYILPFDNFNQIAKYLTQHPTISYRFGISYHIRERISPNYEHLCKDYDGTTTPIYKRENIPYIVSANSLSDDRFMLNKSHLDEISDIVKKLGTVNSVIVPRTLTKNANVHRIIHENDSRYVRFSGVDGPPIYQEYYTGLIKYNPKKARSIRQRYIRDLGFRYNRKSKKYEEVNITRLGLSKNLTIHGAYQKCYSEVHQLLGEIRDVLYFEKYWKEDISGIEQDALSYDIRPIELKYFHQSKETIEKERVYIDKVNLIATNSFCKETGRFERLIPVRSVRKLIKQISYHSRRVPDYHLFKIRRLSYYRPRLDSCSFLFWWVNKCEEADRILPFDIGGFIKDAKSYYHGKTEKAIDRFTKKEGRKPSQISEA